MSRIIKVVLGKLDKDNRRLINLLWKGLSESAKEENVYSARYGLMEK